MEEQFDAQRDLDSELREREAKQLEEFRNKVRLPINKLLSSVDPRLKNFQLQTDCL